MPFMDEPPGREVSAGGRRHLRHARSALRALPTHTVNKEPKWRHPRAELTTGYHPRAY